MGIVRPDPVARDREGRRHIGNVLGNRPLPRRSPPRPTGRGWPPWEGNRGTSATAPSPPTQRLPISRPDVGAVACGRRARHEGTRAPGVQERRASRCGGPSSPGGRQRSRCSHPRRAAEERPAIHSLDGRRAASNRCRSPSLMRRSSAPTSSSVSVLRWVSASILSKSRIRSAKSRRTTSLHLISGRAFILRCNSVGRVSVILGTDSIMRAHIINVPGGMDELGGQRLPPGSECGQT